jgi:hypothetical protein
MSQEMIPLFCEINLVIKYFLTYIYINPGTKDYINSWKERNQR